MEQQNVFPKKIWELRGDVKMICELKLIYTHTFRNDNEPSYGVYIDNDIQPVRVYKSLPYYKSEKEAKKARLSWYKSMYKHYKLDYKKSGKNNVKSNY